MKIASWNINSVRFRMAIVTRFIEEEAPDILCLQETKAENRVFPEAEFRALGYHHIAPHGQKMHHGVAILSKVPLIEDLRHDWQDNGEARHIGVRLPNGVRLENVYIPAGGDTPDRAANPKFGQKLDFFERMTRWSEDLREPTIILGDFNVAPLECDVWSHKQLLNVVSHTPIEVETLGRLQASHDWVDLGRHFIPRARTALHLVELPREGLDGGRQGAKARPCLGKPRGRARHSIAPRGRDMPQLGQAIGSHSADHRVRFLSGSHAVARAIDALRRGWPVVIDGVISILAIETADEPRLAAFDPGNDADLLISSGRAVTLKLANQREAATPDAPVMVAREAWLDLPAATALSNPATDLAHPLQGPYRALPCEVPEPARAALLLARHAGLLPAFFVSQSTENDTAVTSAAIASWDAPETLKIAARAQLPVEASETCEIVAFRSSASANEHVALLIGAPNGQSPLVRLHSECLTGDVLGSLKCDCGPQLNAALAAIAGEGWGILLYLRQEGRGIGLINKLRAYQLQDQGFDTVDANTRLGFAIDARDFGTAARMLMLLGQDRIRLMTNNPEKVAALEAAGVTVVERVPHALPPGVYNAHYLATKRDRTGHFL